MSRYLLGLLAFVIWIGGSRVARATVTPSPDTLDFGTIAVNAHKDLPVVLHADVQTDNVTIVLSPDVGCGDFLVVSPMDPIIVGGAAGDQQASIRFNAQTTGNKTCTINIKQGSTTFATITASGHAAAPRLTLTPTTNSTLDFDHVDVGGQSDTALTITARNDGQVPLTISGASIITGGTEFTVTGPSPSPSTPTTVAAGATATWSVKCNPTDKGTRTGTFQIVSDSSVDSTANISLTCVGDQGAVTTMAANINFGLVQETTTKQLTFQVTNSGNVAITGLDSLTGVLSPTNKHYTVTTDAPASLGVGLTATFTVTFAPTANTDGGGGALNITGHWGHHGTVTPSFSFTGTPALVAVTTTLGTSPVVLDFGNFRFDQMPTRTYRISNNGPTSIMLNSADVTPDVAPTATPELPTTFTAQSLAASAHLDVTVTAKPASRTGVLGAHIDVLTNVAGASLHVNVSGTSQAAAVMATAMADFGAVDIDARPSPTRTVVLENTGNATLDFSLSPMSGGSSAFDISGMPTGASTLAPGAQLAITVTYHPTIEKPAGQGDTAVLVASLAGVLGGPTTSTITLTGRGIDRHIQVDAAPTFPPVFRNPGDQAPIRAVTVHNTGDAVLRIQAVMLASDPGGLQLLDTSSIDIPAHGSQDLRIKFAPTTVGAVTGTLTIMNDDDATPMASVALTGTCMDRMISFGPQTIDLGFTGLGIPIRAADILAVTNMNQQGFKIHGIVLDDDSVFHIDNAPEDAALDGGARQTFSITFAPTSIDKFTTTAHLLIDQDPTGEGMDVQLTGQGLFAQVYGGGGGCSAGGRGGLMLGLLALALLQLRRRRTCMQATVAPPPSTRRLPRDARLIAPIFARPLPCEVAVASLPTARRMQRDAGLIAPIFVQRLRRDRALASPPPAPWPQHDPGLIAPMLRPLPRDHALASPPSTPRPQHAPQLIAPMFVRRLPRDRARCAEYEMQWPGRQAEVDAPLSVLPRRRARPLWAVLAACAALAAGLALAPTARADDIGVTAFAPTPSTTGTAFALQPADVGASGSWVAHAVVSYASNPLLLASFTDTGGRVNSALIAHSTLLQLGGAYALLDRLELGAHFPLYQQSGDTGPTGQPAHGTAAGNLAMHARLRLWRTSARPGALVVGASAIAVLPTASNGQFTGADQPEGRLLLLGSFTPAVLDGRLALSVNVGPVIRSTAAYANIEQKSGVAWGAGASLRILDQLWATAEVFGESTRTEHRAMMDGAPPVALTPIEGLAGVTVKPERWLAIGVAIGRGVTDAAGSPDLRGVLSLAVVPAAPPPLRAGPERERDSDGDGIADARDKCPDEPEDRDGFQDQDGCPDPDNDSDGIADARDRCPNDPEDKDGFQDDDGCPDPDNDIDGIADAADKCPNQAETVNGFQDEDGCPDEIASTATGSQIKAAEAAFAQGRDLMRRGNYAAACAAFEQSQRIDPARGTQYNLAGCYAQVGKLATAWSLFRDLERSDSNDVRRTRSAEQAAALAPRVPRLKLVLKHQPPGVQVRMNGQNAAARIGVEAPVDLGGYAVVAEAPGYQPWRATVEITDEGKVATMVIDLVPTP